jgi:hypothetical protein
MPLNARDFMSQLLSRLRGIPFRFHWIVVILMAFVIPALTAKTEKPGEFYPFSNFPMYSRFAPDTYYVYVTDLNNVALPSGGLFGTSVSNVKKAYDRKLTNFKAEAGGKGKKADLPLEKKKEAADEVLHWLAKNAPDAEKVRALGGLRLHQVDVVFKNGKVSKSVTQVGEIQFSKS